MESVADAGVVIGTLDLTKNPETVERFEGIEEFKGGEESVLYFIHGEAHSYPMPPTAGETSVSSKYNSIDATNLASKHLQRYVINAVEKGVVHLKNTSKWAKGVPKVKGGVEKLVDGIKGFFEVKEL